MIIRALIGLAVCVVLLAWLGEMPQLYAVAGGVGGIALGLGLYRFWNSSSAHPKGAAELTDEDLNPTVSSPEDEEPPPVSDPTPTGSAAAEESRSPGAPPSTSANGSSSAPPAEVASTETPSHSTSDGMGAEQSELPPHNPRVTALVQALRHTLQAHTVALFVQEEMMTLEYDIAGIDSASNHVQHHGSFSTPYPLLGAGMSRNDVTVQQLGNHPELRNALNYYDGPVSIDKIAFAPVRYRPDAATTYFIVVDAPADIPLEHRRTKALIASGADMLVQILNYDPDALREPVTASSDSASASASHADQDEPEEGAAQPAPDRPQQSSDASSRPSPSTESERPSNEVKRPGPRPRNEIIAEEVDKADMEDRPMGFALVLVNRYEIIAEHGQGAINEAEEALHDVLRESAPGYRIERFGELMYGAFLHTSIDAIEEWALSLHRAMLRTDGPLKGGVSIGVVMLAPRHEKAQDLRDDGLRALHEAHRSGSPVLFE